MVLNPVVPDIIYSVCNAQHHAQNTERYINIPTTMQQPLFKFWSAAAFHSGTTGLIMHATYLHFAHITQKDKISPPPLFFCLSQKQEHMISKILWAL